MWRYQYNASKCAVVVFNSCKIRNNNNPRDYTVYLGDIPLDGVEHYKLLGIICHRRSFTSCIVKDCCDKIRGTFFSLVKYGFNDDGLQPLTCKHIYNAVVIPKALYGSECWPLLSKTDMLTLERAHRLCLKYIQGLSARTSTEVMLSLLNCLPIEYEIDRRKLILFGQLCRLETECAIKSMFLHRLCLFTLGNAGSGFLPEVGRILDKHGMRSILIQYLSDGSFPCKDAWKKMVKAKTKNTFVTEWNARTSVDAFSRFRVVHKHFDVSFLWVFTKTNTKLIAVVKVVAQLIAYLLRFDDQCIRCELSHLCNFTDHLLLDCPYVASIRNDMYLKLAARFGIDLVQTVRALPRHALVHTLLCLWHPLIEGSLLSSECYNDFLCTVFRCIYTMYLAYPR